MKTRMSLLITTILLFSMCNGRALSYNEKSYKSSDKKYSFIQEYKASSPMNLKISTSGGNITTTGREESDKVEVTFIVTRRGQVLDITLEELKNLADVEIISENGSLEINIRKMHEKNMSVGFSIKTPIKSSSNLNTSGGNISLTSVTGTQNIHTSGGNIDFEKINGNVEAGTSGGNVSINNSTADINASTSGGNISLNHLVGKLNVSTSGGNIDADDLKPLLIAHTSGGNIQLKKIQGTVDVNTSGGSIHLSELSGSVKAMTSGGDITASLLQLTEKLELETSGGSINATIPVGLGLDLDLSADQINTPLSNFTGSAKKDRIKGKMNGGGILVHLSTSGGSLSLNYK
jgi:hypothetical protein